MTTEIPAALCEHANECPAVCPCQPHCFCRRAGCGFVLEAVDHPSHYGGTDNVYEAIKVVEAWGLGFCLGNTVKYISRADKKGSAVEDLKKARWYLDREITNREKDA